MHLSEFFAHIFQRYCLSKCSRYKQITCFKQLLLEKKLYVKTLSEMCIALEDTEIEKLNRDVSRKYSAPGNTVTTWVKNKEKNI